MHWRLVDSDLSEPTFTVAADEAIALARSKDLVPNTLHFYRRNVPTISLGYFQKVEKAVDLKFCEKNKIQLVRRVSGGGAIYTDENHLIYGLIVDEGQLPKNKEKAYEKACSGIVLALEMLGVRAEFKPINDVLVDGRKISGSAQRRRADVVLQHGTIILDNDPEMMFGALRPDEDKMRKRGLGRETYVTSLREILGRKVEASAVKKALTRSFGEVFDVEFEKGSLTPFEKSQIEKMISEKFGRREWNLRR
jgi:lipoate-protein ligase A